MPEYQKPLPAPNQDTAPFWEACRRHELMLQRCLDCGAYRFPPAPVCSNPMCSSLRAQWVRVSGKGELYTWTVFHRVYHPGFAREVPYNVALIQLAEGPKLLSKVVGCRHEDLRIGMPVEVVFEDITQNFTLHAFKPAG